MVEEAAAVLRVLGGDDEARTAQGDEVLQRGVEPLAEVPGQNGRGAPLAIREDLKKATAGGIVGEACEFVISRAVSRR